MSGELDIIETLDNGQFINALGQSESRFKQHVSGIKSGGSEIDDAMKKVGEMMAVYFSVEGIKQFGTELINVRGEFQQIGIAFDTMLGSKEKGNELMEQMISLAAHTPYTLTDVAAGAKQLLAFQVAQQDVNDTLIRLGNISSGISVPLGQLVHVYGQIKAAGTMDGRTLRELTMAGFPIIHELAQQMGIADTEVKKVVESGGVSFEEFDKVIKKVTNSGGMFFNLMQLQSQTLTGKLSNLKDAWDEMLNNIGKSNDGILSGAIDEAINLTKHYEDVLGVIMPLVAAYGAYKAAIIAISLTSEISNVVAYSQAFLETAKSLGVATAAQTAFNMESKANVYIAAAVALAALTAVVYHFASAQTEVEKAREEMNQAVDEESANLSIMFDRLKNATAGTKEYQSAKDAIVSKYGQYDSMLNSELNTVGGIAQAYKSLTKAVEEAAKARLKDKYMKESGDKTAEEITSQYKTIRNELINSLGKAKGTALFDSVKSSVESGGDWKTLLKKNGIDTGTHTHMDDTGSYQLNNSPILDSIEKIKMAQTGLNNEVKEYDQIFGSVSGKVSTGNKKNTEETISYTKQVEDAKKAIKAAKDALTAERLKPVSVSDESEKDTKLKELDGKVKSAQEYYNRLTNTKPQKAKTTGVNAPYGTLEYWDAILKKLKNTVASSDQLTGKYYTKNGTDISSRIDFAQQEIKRLTPKDFDGALNYQKEQYQQYYKTILEYGKDFADKQYASLLKGGSSYTDMLEKKKTELGTIISGGKATTEQITNFQKLNDELNGIYAVRTEWDKFTETMSKLKTESKSTEEYIKKLNDLKSGLKDTTDGGKLTPEQKKTASGNIDETTRKATEEEWTALLEKYKTYKVQLSEIDQKYDDELSTINKKIAIAEIDNNEKEVDRLKGVAQLRSEQHNKDVSAVGDSLLKQTSLYKRLFENLSDLGVGALSKLQNAAKNSIAGAVKNTASDGTVTYKIPELKDLNGNVKQKEMTVSEQQYQAYVEKIKSIGDEIGQKNPFKPIFDDLDNLIKGHPVKTKDIFKDASGALDAVNSVMSSVNQGLDTMGIKMDDQTKKVFADVQGMVSGAADLAKGIATGNPISIIQGSISLVSNGIDLIWGAKDRKVQKAIKADEDAVKALQLAYTGLKKAVDDAYGQEYFQDQAKVLANLKAQLALEQDEVKLQESRSGKKKDQSAIDSAKSAAQQTADDIEAIYTAMSDKIMTTTGKDFASTLGNSIFDAIASGADAFDVIDEKSNEVVQNIVKQWLQTKLLETPLESMLSKLESKITTKVGDTWTENDLNTPEAKQAFEDFQNGVKNLGTSYADILSQMTYLFDGATTSANSKTGAIKGVSQETAGVIEGEMTGIRLSQDRQESILGSTLKVNQQQLDVLNSINDNGMKISEKIDEVIKTLSDTDTGLRAKGIIP